MNAHEGSMCVVESSKEYDVGTVRALAPGDRDEAVNLVKSIWEDDPVFGQADALTQGRFSSAHAAVDPHGQLVGVATLGGPSRHPHRFVTVDVEQSARRRNSELSC